MKTINSLKNPYIKNLKKLLLKKYRYQQQLFLIAGWHLVSEACSAQVVTTIIVLDDDLVLQKWANLSNYDAKMTILKVPDYIINNLTSNVTPQPILAVCEMKAAKISETNNILLLDNIQNPNNLGAILRSSVAFGINTIILSNDSVDIYNEKVINASQGAIFKVNCVYSDIIKKVTELKNNGYYFFGTVLKTTTPTILSEITLKSKNVFIFGNEGQGISKKLYPYIDENFIIPMTNAVESLNLSISIAITFYHLFTNKLTKLK